MAIYFNQQITSFGGCQSFGMGCMPMPMAPVPMFPAYGCYPMSDAMAAGYCTGAVLAMPGVLQAVGNGLKWGYNNIIKPVWNGVVKPAWNFVKNDILKPIGSGLKWLWDHSLGWCLKKLQGATSKSKADEGADDVKETSAAAKAAEAEDEE